MKKKLFAILLALALLLSSMLSLSEVSFAQGENYVLTDSDGGQLLATDVANTLISYMNTPGNFDQTNSYTLTLKEDLVIPVDASTSKLKTLEIHCNLTIEGNEKTITGDAGGQDKDRLINIKLEKGDITINKLNFDGSNKYAGINVEKSIDSVPFNINLNSCHFENCLSDNGGALYISCGPQGGLKFTIKDSTFKNCSANWGGAICIIGLAEVTLEDTSISNCKATEFGGAIYSNMTIKLELKSTEKFRKSSITSCTAKNGGGAIFMEASLDYKDNIYKYKGLFISNYEIKDCEATGGGAMVLEAVTVNFDNLTIENCKAPGSGGAIYGSYFPGIIKNSKFINNESLGEAGTSIGLGGAIYMEYRVVGIELEKLRFEDSILDGNKANYGGAIAFDGAFIELANTEVKNSVAKILTFVDNGYEYKYGGDGAAIYSGFEGSDSNSIFNIIDGSKITNNSADRLGGGIYAKRSAINIDKSTIEKNSALNGGGVYLEGGSAEIKNESEIKENEARFSIVEEEDSYSGEKKQVITGKGAGLYIIPSNNSEYKIYNSKIINNKAGALGGGIYFLGAIYEVNGMELYVEEHLYNILKYLPYYIKLNKATFEGNTAGFGFYNPPNDIESIKTDPDAVSDDDYNALMSANNSCKDKLIMKGANDKWQHIESLINNYDIDYINPITTTTYMENFDKNGIYVNQELTTKDYQDPVTNEISGHDIKVLSYEKTKLKENPDTTKPFRIWNKEKDGKGTDRKVDAEISGHKGNMTLFAQWGAKPVPPTPVPEPKPTEPNKYILTLDENYRGGEITDHEVEEGELIAPYLYIPRRRGYIFRGWSYDRKHLEEVKPEDRIYTDTILYAIWKKAETEKKEEPEEIRGDDHKAYIFGYPNGTVRPNGNITRAEAAAMLARLLNIEAIGSSAKPNFKDTESAWYNKAINAIVARGIMKGYPDGRFRPNAPITRAEFTQMISTIDNKPYGEAPFIDVKGHWAERAIGSEYQAKRITGYPDVLFRPDANITRAEAAVILNKIFERNYDAMSLAKCKNALMLKRFIDLDETFWGYNDMVEATNTHEYIRRYKGMVQEDWLLIK